MTEVNEKANALTSYYTSVFGCERNVPQTQPTHLSEPFTINTKMIRRRQAAIGRNKSVGPDVVPSEILILDVQAMIPYLARFLYVTVNNASNPGDWKRATVVPIYKRRFDRQSQATDWSALNSVVCKQWNTPYLRQVWDTSKWLYEREHGFRPGYWCESQIVTVCRT